jgi:hypothetical protein
VYDRNKGGALNLQVLRKALGRVGIPETLVSLGERRDQAWCLVPSSAGDGWEVYWRSGRDKHARVVLESESSACFYLLGKLVYDQMLAGEFEFPG